MFRDQGVLHDHGTLLGANSAKLARAAWTGSAVFYAMPGFTRSGVRRPVRIRRRPGESACWPEEAGVAAGGRCAGQRKVVIRQPLAATYEHFDNQKPGQPGKFSTESDDTWIRPDDVSPLSVVFASRPGERRSGTRPQAPHQSWQSNVTEFAPEPRTSTGRTGLRAKRRGRSGDVLPMPAASQRPASTARRPAANSRQRADSRAAKVWPLTRSRTVI